MVERMGDDLCLLGKDTLIAKTLIAKTPKKSPLVSRMFLLVFAMICGIFICSICLKQISTQPRPKSMNLQLFEWSCQVPGVKESEHRYLHYPKPKTYSRAECACNPVRLFAILSMQRSGSGWFETLLNSHINVSSNGEIFSVKERRSNISTIFKTLDKVYNLDWVSSASKNECSAAVGFKWMLNQGLIQHHQEIVEYFKRRGVSAIFLFRRNLLRRMVSVLANSYDRDAKLLNGTHKSHVHSPKEAEILASYKPTIDTKLLLPNLRNEQNMSTRAMEYFKSTNHIVLYYEDLVNNRSKLSDVLKFLRIPHMKLKSRQVKIHKGSLSEQIGNWDEVHKALKGTQYESFLQEDYKF